MNCKSALPCPARPRSPWIGSISAGNCSHWPSSVPPVSSPVQEALFSPTLGLALASLVAPSSRGRNPQDRQAREQQRAPEICPRRDTIELVFDEGARRRQRRSCWLILSFSSSSRPWRHLAQCTHQLASQPASERKTIPGIAILSRATAGGEPPPPFCWTTTKSLSARRIK